MAVLHKVGIVSLVAVLVAPVASLGAQQGRIGDSRDREIAGQRPGSDEGYRQGLRFGEDHARRGAPLNFGVVLEYRQGDIGYRASFGNRDNYRSDFRIGFERGYREAYTRYVPARRGPEVIRRDFAFDTGFNDGYSEGLNDGRRNHRNDPFAESRFRSADHGFNSRYGSREFYRTNYRAGFRDGYERGYLEGRRRW